MWTYIDKDKEVNWSETLSAKYLKGDGSGLTNVGAGSEVDPFFTASSNAFVRAEVDPFFNASSSAYNSHLADATIHFTSNAIWSSLSSINNTLNLVSSSQAYTSTATTNHLQNATIHFTSNGLWTSMAAIQTYALTTSSAATSHIQDATKHFTSNAIWASLSAVTASYGNHAADSSDPHGATLTQTNLSFSSASRTGDWTTASSAYIANVVFAPSSAGITASNYTQGTVFLIYT